MSISYRKQAGALITGQMVSLALSFVLPLILVRVLNQTDYGLYAQFNVILSFCSVFFSFGFSSELYYSYPLAQPAERRILIFQSLTMLFVAGVLALGILCLPVVKENIISDETFSDNYIYLLLSVWLSVPEILITALYVLNHDHLTSALFLPSMTLLRVGLIFLFYWQNPTVESVFLAITASVIIKFVYVLYYVGRLIRKHPGVCLFDRVILKNQLKYSLPLGLASSTRVFVQQLDRLIILSFVSPALYAIYSIAFYGVPGLNQVYLSISQVYIPRMATAFKQNDSVGVIGLYHSMVTKTLSYTVPIVLVIILFADPIIPYVFSEKYIASIPYFQIYLLTFIVSSVGCGNILRATGETKKSLMAYIYTAVFLVPFTYFAIKFFSLNGAITAATAGAILPKVLLSLYDARAIGVRLGRLFPWAQIGRIFTTSFACLIPFILGYCFLGHHNFWLSLCWIAAYLLLAFALQMYYGVFIISYDDLRRYLGRFIKI